MEVVADSVNIDREPDQNSFVESAEKHLNSLGITVESASESDDEDCDSGRSKPTENPNRTVSRVPHEISSVNNPPVFGSVSVTNSSEVHFGNKTVINGPVTIKQVIGTGLGIENHGYVKTEGDSTSNALGKANNASRKDDQATEGRFKWLISPQYILLGLFAFAITASLITLITIFLERSQEEGYTTTVLPELGPKYQILVTKAMCAESSNVVFVTIGMGILMLVSILIAVALSRIQYDTKSDRAQRVESKSAELLPNSKLRYVTRTDWIAQPVEEPLSRLKLPARWVIIAHTASENCTTQSECVLIVRNVQTYHIESRKWSDIGYNFLVGGDGSAYIGRGWDYQGAHTKYYNSRSIGIAFIGTFNNIDPPRRQVMACKQLIEDGIALGKIAKDYKLFGHRQLMSTLSPGDRVYSIIQQWPHWSDNNTDTE